MKQRQFNGWGIVEIALLILVIGVLLLVLLRGITTSVVVVNDMDKNEKAMSLANSYLNNVYDEAKNKAFYDSFDTGDFPPIPLTSDYTDSGVFSVSVETKSIDLNSKQVSITYRYSSSTSYDDPILTLSTIVEAP